ncbi:MAG: proline reductase-associated electron transfer protein PrdC [Defluviitaleaceae bacterium]|nr:proline reductase-associated electron transfer protein PrdC [Defluviitaleaceae bacterium]
MPEYICIEMKQHVGTPGKPLVNVGDKVKKGQLIAVCEGLGANIHSSVYGEVAGIDAKAVRIIPDAEQPEEYIKIRETDSYLEAVKEAGVVGAGGAGFPTHVKYNTKLEGGCVILNAAECEPILKHNMSVIKEHPDLLVRGVKYAMEMTGAKKGYIAIKPKHTAELIAIAKACKSEANIEVKYLADRYPSGDERSILRELLGVVLKPGQLPLDANAIVSNVETIRRIAEAIELRKPVITKDLTVGGRLLDTQDSSRVYLDQPIGTSVKKYIDECGGYLQPHGEILLGGPFTGKSGSEESVVTKILSGVFVAMPFPVDHRKFGVLACECGAGEERLGEIVAGMGGTVVAEAKCKRMVEIGGRFRCEEPGNCPGQAEKVLGLKAKGAEVIIAGSCED